MSDSTTFAGVEEIGAEFYKEKTEIVISDHRRRRFFFQLSEKREDEFSRESMSGIPSTDDDEQQPVEPVADIVT
ncbi:hypothetical protein AAHA92_06684 [Salvia divinorum]|uniref:Uncharacterized protein n=1 Tax=Salvia divinorum TaxID=28513 RepID=A0ABD1I6H6_SALDI